MENTSILSMIQLAIGSGGLLGVGYLIFKTGKIVERIESLDEKVDKLDHKINKVDEKVEDLRDRVSHIEGFLMGPEIFVKKFKGK